MSSKPRIVLATTNRHKIDEFRALLADVPCELIGPADLDLVVEVEETGTTFHENAVLKAIAYAEAANLPALADDSGLEIDALGGEPGVYSARWAGEDTPYEDRFRILFERLTSIADERRTARYHCVIAVAQPAPHGLYTMVDGTLEGRISREACGSGGFGYDPIFYVPEKGRTVGEMTPAEKHAISHRGRAAAAVREPLKRLLELRASEQPS